MTEEKILLAHGAGGKLYHDLVEQVFLPAFGNAMLNPLTDAAVCQAGEQIAFTTDSFVVQPRFFPGGDIGRLAVCGTVNDLAMSGAEPLYLSVGMILEAGLPLPELKCIVASMQKAAQEAGIQIVTGDTKVVEKGGCDGIYINTAGIGVFRRKPLAAYPQPGDVILVSGELAAHGLAVLAARQNMEFEPALRSDVAPLNSLAATLLHAVPDTRCLRDPTRGGIAATLNEWAAASGCRVVVEEQSLPIAPAIHSACELLGFDPCTIANEGIFLAAVPQAQVEAALAALRQHPLGINAAKIAMVEDQAAGQVVLTTPYGTQRLLDLPRGELLPRIC